MPLVKSDSRKAISANIKREMEAGKSQRQSIAIAMDVGRRNKAGGGRVGALTGATGGRADKLPMKVPNGSHVIPADVVSALGQGNSQNGHKVLASLFPHSSSPQKRAGGGGVDIMASDGEFVVSPEDVEEAGRGDAEHGHNVLDHFIVHTRKQNIQHLSKLPAPPKD
jgi:hypothetical protein